MKISSKLITTGQVKFIMIWSCRSHQTTVQIARALNGTKIVIEASNASADTICSGLTKLTEVYKYMGDLLNSPSKQDLISHDQNKKLVEELTEKSLTFLDVCSSIKHMVTQLKDHNRDLQSALRRRKCENEIFEKYNCFREKMKKDVKLCNAGLKQVGGSPSVVVDSELAAVMQAIKGVSETTVSVFEFLLLYLCRLTSKPNRWSSVVSKLIHKGKVACEDQQQHGNVNEFESIDAADMQALCKNGSSTKSGEKMQIAKCRLERQETHLDCMENRLECIFRLLIETRVSLLNIMSL